MKRKDKDTLRIVMYAATTANKTDFERGITYACTTLAAMIDAMPTEPDDPKKPETEPAVFGEWHKPTEKLPESGKDVLVELENNHGVMVIWHYNEATRAWFDTGTGVKRSASIARWCYLPEGLPF